jgi:hypothetical protein
VTIVAAQTATTIIEQSFWLTGQIIIPSYVYQAKIEILATNITAFNSVNHDKSSSCKNLWLEAYKAYQYVAIYSFGKSEELQTER